MLSFHYQKQPKDTIAMSDVKIISVHPAEKTLGSLHPEVMERMKRVARFKVLSYKSEQKLRRRVDFFFAIKGRMLNTVSCKLAVIRCLAAVLVAGSPFIGFTGVLSPLSIVIIALGVMLAAGFLTRFVSLGIAGIMAYDFIVNFVPSDPDITIIFGMIPFIGLALLGAGKLSLDALMRHRIYRCLTRRRERRLAAVRMSYNAYGYCK